MILLLSLFLLSANIIATVLRESEVAETIIGKPWKVVSGMIESGTWEVNDAPDHPFHPVKGVRDRGISVRGDDVR